jgi:hypothetical protein
MSVYKIFKQSISGPAAMRVAYCATAAIVATLLIWIPDTSAKTNAPKPTSSANPVNYGKTVQITGALKGNPSAGLPIALQQSPFPYSAYTSVATASTSATGAYAFSVIPLINTRYRVVTTAATPQVISGELAQVVNQRVSFSVGDKTPKKGVKVRFFGTVTPAADGKYVSLQKRSSTGAYNTISRIKLVDAGDARSSYSRRIRVSKSATYRVTVAATQSLGAGTSATRTLRVH